MLNDFDEREKRARRLLDAVRRGEEMQRQELPPALAERLRAIPRQAIGCDAVERLYRQSLVSAEDGPGAGAPAAGAPAAGDPAAGDPAARQHLASCPRCRRLYAPIRALADDPRRRPLPPRLGQRLRAIPRRSRPAWWIRDSRYAAAICLLTASLVAATGSLQADQLIEVTRGAGQRTGDWIVNSQHEGSGVTEEVRSRLAAGVSRGQDWLKAAGTAWRSFVATTEEHLRRLPAVLEVEPSPNEAPKEGESHGQYDRNPETPRS